MINPIAQQYLGIDFSHITPPEKHDTVIAYSDIAKLCSEKKYSRCIMIVRHSERPSIDINDPTFGASLPLTEYGTNLAISCGKALKDVQNLKIFASPSYRTCLTAKYIAEGYGITNPEIPTVEESGLNGIYVYDAEKLFISYKTLSSVYVNNGFVRGLKIDGFSDIDKATLALYDWLTNKLNNGEGNLLVTSHDIFIGGFMTSFGFEGLCTDDWIGYVQGAALFKDESSKYHIYRCVPDKSNYKSIYIQ